MKLNNLKLYFNYCTSLITRFLIVLAAITACSMPQPEFALPTVGALEPAPGPIPYPQDAGACSVKKIERSNTSGLTIFSHDGTKYLVNKEDENEIPQIYVGNAGDKNHVCITCEEKENGPKASKFKMQPHWNPSDEWIILAVEQEKHDKPWWASKDIVEGWLQSGIWVDMFVVRVDGSEWHKLQDFGPGIKANGFVGTSFTADGKQAVWAQIVDGNVFAYSFGRWEIILADYQEVNGVPSFVNLRDITPDTFWVEPGNFAPDSNDLLLSADTGFPDHSKVQGQDQYIYNIDSGEITNLTNTPVIWDEHGVFSPDGKKVFFMSSYPYPKQ